VGRFFKTFFNGPAYLITRFLPWSVLTIVALVLVGPRKWFRSPAGGAVLWIAIWVAVFSFASTKRPDRYAPVYPAMAVLAAYAVCVLIGRIKGLEGLGRAYTPARVAAAGLVVAAGLCVHSVFFSDMARERYGDHVIAFAKAVREQTKGEQVLFLDGEQTPLEGLLGHVQEDPAPRAAREAARWVVHFIEPGAVGGRAPVLVSEPIDQVDGNAPGKLGLYRIEPGEGERLYAESLHERVQFADDAGTIATAEEARKRWLQFWRLHSALTGGSAATMGGR
jgi:hypothetical protein